MAEHLKPWVGFHLMLADVGICCLPLSDVDGEFSNRNH